MVQKLNTYLSDVLGHSSFNARNNARLHQSKLSVLLEECLIGNYNLNCILGVGVSENFGFEQTLDAMTFGQRLVQLGISKREALVSNFASSPSASRVDGGKDDGGAAPGVALPNVDNRHAVARILR